MTYRLDINWLASRRACLTNSRLLGRPFQTTTVAFATRRVIRRTLQFIFPIYRMISRWGDTIKYIYKLDPPQQALRHSIPQTDIQKLQFVLNGMSPAILRSGNIKILWRPDTWYLNCVVPPALLTIRPCSLYDIAPFEPHTPKSHPYVRWDKVLNTWKKVLHIITR